MYFMDIGDESDLFSFVFPENYETALAAVKNSSFLNRSIADHHWAGPIMANMIMNDDLTKDEIIAEINKYHTGKKIDTIKVWLYFAQCLITRFC